MRKELSKIQTYQYFGARYYDSDLSVWLSVDPLADKYPSMSSYMYTAGNPVMLVDPDGMRIDDYFNKLGEYLGSDDAKTDNVRIIGQKEWDNNKSVNKDGSETINHKVGVENSELHSKSGISDDASLKVYDHYNPTDLKLVKSSGGKAGMSLTQKTDFFGITELKIGVKLLFNKWEGYSDNANEIINMFEHESKHYSDLKEMGIKKFLKIFNTSHGKKYLERRAIDKMINHESFNNCSEKYKLGVYKYAVENGYGIISKVKIKQLPKIE